MSKTNPLEYESIAREIFAPIYPVIAEQILKATEISRGKCVDLGTGTGLLGLAIAAISDLKVCLLDISPEMLDYADQNIRDKKMEQQVHTVKADVHQLPFPDQSIDLIVSRGSIFFWDDLRKALQETYRVLAPGGVAYMGGGFGSNELKDQIEKKMAQKDEKWAEKATVRMQNFASSNYEKILHELKIPYQVKCKSGFWIIIERGPE